MKIAVVGASGLVGRTILTQLKTTVVIAIIATIIADSIENLFKFIIVYFLFRH